MFSIFVFTTPLTTLHSHDAQWQAFAISPSFVLYRKRKKSIKKKGDTSYQPRTHMPRMDALLLIFFWWFSPDSIQAPFILARFLCYYFLLHSYIAYKKRDTSDQLVTYCALIYWAKRMIDGV